MMEVDESIREMILSGAPVRKIRSYHKSRTSADLRSLGLAMVKAGETTLEELERLVYDVE